MPVPFDPPLTEKEILAALPDRYTDIQPVKAGGQGAVFKCLANGKHGAAAGEAVALKVFSTTHLEERTVREVGALRKLKVDTLVQYVDTGHCTLRGVTCVWLETGFIDGQSLGQLIAIGSLPVEQVSAILHDVALGIEQLWSARIVHRDIKPENIMVTPDGRGVLIDLGLARHLDLSSVTGVGLVVGTIGYCSPEQALGARNLSCKSDVFALGIAAQHAILGRHPTNGDQGKLMSGGCFTGALGKTLPGPFIQMVDRMVRKQAHTRPLPGEVTASMKQLFKRP